MIILDGVADNFYGLAVFIAFLVGLLLGGVFFGKGNKEAVSKANEEISSLKSELEAATKQTTVVKEQLDNALESSKSLALSWAQTYQNLEAAKATMEGDEVKAQKYMLAIKNGKLEKIEYKDEDVDSLKAKAKEKVEDIKEAVADKAKAAKEAVKETAKDVKDALATKTENAKESVKETAKDVKDAVASKAETAKEVAKDAKDAVANKAQDVKAAVKETTKEAAQATKDAVANTAKDVKDVASKEINKLKK